MKSNLNEKQKEAVYLDFGPALIMAGPGSGKTTVILERIKHLIYDLHISPKHILVITFTKAAALQMQTRAVKMINTLSESPIFGTFHSFFYSILKSSYEYQFFSILTEKQKYKNLERLLITKYQMHRISNNFIQEILICISKYKNDMNIEAEILKLGLNYEKFIELCNCYDYFNREQRKMDYDDIILYAYKLLTNHPGLLQKLQHEISHILVDEFQDINKQQYELIALLSGKRGHIFVVGDDDQSIYKFRGAGEENLLQFEKDFAPVQKVVLGSNYRCPKRVVQLSAILISHNEKRFEKALISEKKQEGTVVCEKFLHKEREKEYVVNMIKTLVGQGENKKIAILCRTNSQLDILAECLKKNYVRFYKSEKGKNFYALPYIKPVVGYLMFACGMDRSRKVLFSFLNKPVRYIQRELFVNWDFGKKDLKEIKTENLAVASVVETLCKMLEIIRKLSPVMAVNYILKVIGYETYAKENCKTKEEVEKFYQTMEELKERAQMYETIEQWMEFVKWEENVDFSMQKVEDKGEEKVCLYTFHGAKGLEFETVFIPHLNEGSVPYGKNLTKEQLEEERRMFYVALTRTSENLYLTYVENDTKKDTVSRFLEECGLTASKNSHI